MNITEPGPGENIQLAHSHLRPVDEIIKHRPTWQLLILTLSSCQCFIGSFNLNPLLYIVNPITCVQVAGCIGLFAARRKKDTISLDIENSVVNLVIKYAEFEVIKRTINVLIK